MVEKLSEGWMVKGHVWLGKDFGLYLKISGNHQRCLKREVDGSDLCACIHAGGGLKERNLEVVGGTGGGNEGNG